MLAHTRMKDEGLDQACSQHSHSLRFVQLVRLRALIVYPGIHPKTKTMEHHGTNILELPNSTEPLYSLISIKS